jgi:hypothetical protein
MTRREQTVRAWITRKSPKLPWKSCVSLHGKTHTITTNTRIRKAAREFNFIHLSNLLAPKETSIITESQPDLFP